MAKYKRVLIKLSGEALGDHGRLFDFDQIDRVADVIRQLHETGTEIAIVIGAGNIWARTSGSCGEDDRHQRRPHGHARHGNQLYCHAGRR